MSSTGSTSIHGPRGRSASTPRRARQAAGAVALAVLAWAGVTLGLRLLYAGSVLPGTQVAGNGLGGLSEAEARVRLEQVDPANRVVTVAYDGRRMRVRGRDVGYRLDAAATTRRAMDAGRSGPMGGLWSGVFSLWSPRDVQPVHVLASRKGGVVLDQLARRVERRSFIGGLSTDPDSLRVRVAPPRRGRALDRARTAAAIVAGLREGRGTTVAPVTRVPPGVRRGDVDVVARRARRYLTVPLELSVAGEPVSVTPRQLSPVLAVEPRGPRPVSRVRLGVDGKRLASLVDGVAARRDREPVEARIVAAANPVILDQKLDLSWRARRAQVRVVPGRTGRRVQRQGAIDAVAAAIRAGRHAAEAPVRPAAPKVPTRSARKVTSLIGTFTTHFPCCAPRVKNITLIAKAVDGTVIPPRGQFALNREAGERTRADGYVLAPFISDGKLVPSVGGGVSQFSTTIYNAAYFAGLDIDSHQPHSEYIDRYPPGREATLNYPTIDLKWTNDTDAPVLVRTASSATSVTVSLYGANGGRRVRARSGPRQPLPGRDFAVTVTREVVYPGGRRVRQPYTTSYDKPPG